MVSTFLYTICIRAFKKQKSRAFRAKNQHRKTLLAKRCLTASYEFIFKYKTHFYTF